MDRMLLWAGLGSWRAEVSRIELDPDRLSASGTQLGADPLPYRADYQLRTGPGFVTERLQVSVTGEGWSRRLDLCRDPDGAWEVDVEQDGPVDLPDAGGDPAAVAAALDCDLGRSPLTNTMPVLRHRLHRDPGAVDFVMAWIAMPALSVQPSRQRYEHLRVEPDGTAFVRYVGAHRGFAGELLLDRDGLVLEYPELARRASPSTTPKS